MSLNLKSPYEMMQDIAKRARAKRLSLNLRQQSLSARSGVPYGTLKKFERTGQISLESLLKLALVLGALDDFDPLFVKSDAVLPASLDELLKRVAAKKRTRKRGRK